MRARVCTTLRERLEFAVGESWTVYEMASVLPGLGIPAPGPGLGLASLLPFLGCYAGVFQPLRRLCLRVALAPSFAWPRSGRALRLLLGRDHDVVGGFSSFSSVVHGIFGAPLSSRFWGRWGWGNGISQFFHGCRKCCELPRGCAVDWGVVGAGGLASPGPNLGARARLFALTFVSVGFLVL